MNIAGRWNDSSLSLTLMKSTIKFVPVIDSPSRLYLVNDSEKVFRIPEKFACFYGQNDNGETIYFYAIYPILLRVFLLSVYVHRMWLDIYYS